jgi:anti-sigma28 factor (negative regulator of flagellin synthesis)
MRIEGLGPIQQPDPKNKKTGDAAKKSDSRPDSVELANKSQEASKAGYSDNLKKGRPIQSAQSTDINQVKQQTDSGYYDTPEIRSGISENLIDSDELKDVVQEYHKSNLAKEIQSKPVEIRHEKVAEVRTKLADGFYNNPSNYGSFADKIISYFGL